MLVEAGWVVLARNWRCRYGELDVIAVDGECLVVVEVKTRSGTLLGDPAEAVTRDKLSRMRRLTRMWLATQDEFFATIRFDVMAVQVDRSAAVQSIRHLRGVF